MAWELMNTHLFKDMEKTRTEMDKLLDTFLFGKPKTSGFAGEEKWKPPVDVAETKSELIINVEIPGLDPGDIEVLLTGDTLLIKGEKKTETEDKREDYHILERNYGSFTRSIHLPVEVQNDKISATYRNGVLDVTLGKRAGASKVAVT